MFVLNFNKKVLHYIFQHSLFFIVYTEPDFYLPVEMEFESNIYHFKG